MGCEDSKESLESKILMLRLKRTAIQKQRKEKIERLKQLIGEDNIVTEPIPDYLENNSNNPNQRENRKIEQKENIFRKNKDFDLDDET